MLDAVLEHFPGQTIKAVFGGFHLIDLPLINSMAGNKDDVEELGKAILKYPIERVYTGHCTGIKAYRILKEVMGAKLEYYCTQNGNKLEIHTAADDSQSGICVFPDGSTCDEWAYYRESVVPQHKQIRCPPRPLKNKLPAVTCHQVLQKK